MKRFLFCVSLLALIPSVASATVLVSAVKEPAPINGLDVYDLHVTGFADVDNTPKNLFQALEGTFTAVNGTIQFDGNTDAQIRTSSTNLLAGNGVSSWVNFDSTVGPLVRKGPAAANSLSGTWYTSATQFKLRPVDVTIGRKDDGFDQTLLAKVFVSPGAGFQFVGITGTSTSSGNGVSPLLLNVNTGGQILPMDVSVSPSNGTLLHDGSSVTISNAGTSLIDLRDTATVLCSTFSNVGYFSVSGLPDVNFLESGQTVTPVITFIPPDASNPFGALNGTVVTGSVKFTVKSGTSGAGSGAGIYSYPLSTIVSNQVGDAQAVVASGASYAGLSGTSGLADDGSPVHLPSTATLLAGSNSNGGDSTLQMKWSLRTPNEQGNLSSLPSLLPSLATTLTSDKVNITGVDGDLFVLQMTYAESELLGHEAEFAALGHLFLAGFDGSRWVNAIDLNHGQNIGTGNVHGAWNGQMELGAWGVDTDANVVWAVLDHNGLFASVPEPTAVLLALVGLVGFCSVIVRRRQSITGACHRQ